MITQTNPLASYFRGEPTYIKLPSGGYYCQPGDIEPTPTGEIPVYPMTTADELLLKSPDSLLNGQSVANIIKSCAPNIKNAFNLSVADIEAILLAIKQVTYGDQIDYETTCPNCKTVNEFGTSIEYILSCVDTIEPENKITLKNNLNVMVRPHTYASSVKIALLSFNETKFLHMLTQEDLTDEEKSEKAAISYKKAINLTIEIVADSIIGVYDKDDKLITEDPKFILEWVKNLNRADAKKIEDGVKKLTEKGLKKDFELECKNCNHVWTTKIEFDPSIFFE